VGAAKFEFSSGLLLADDAADLCSVWTHFNADIDISPQGIDKMAMHLDRAAG
jgi:hypothetical protein